MSSSSELESWFRNERETCPEVRHGPINERTRESKRDGPLTQETDPIPDSIVRHEQHSKIRLILAGRLNGRFHQVFHLVLAARWGRSQWEPLYSDSHGRSGVRGRRVSIE
jgi:hypothetical protein